MKIQFYIRFHTQYGESLWVSGNCRELGKEDPAGSLPMKYYNHDYWFLEVEMSTSCLAQPLSYHYAFRNKEGELIPEQKNSRLILLPETTEDTLVLYDTWIATGEIENAFYTAPFREVLLPSAVAPVIPAPSHTFAVKAPLLKENEAVCLLGNTEELHNWKTDNPILMNRCGDHWCAQVPFSKSLLSFEYKYGVYDTRRQHLVCYEEGGNRLCSFPFAPGTRVVLQDGFIRLPSNTWRGAGVAVPVFSLRSEKGMGIGEFNDLKLLADWAQRTGLKLIQILPVNDTTATFTWRDSYPYAAISAFALHPIYLNLDTLVADSDQDLIAELDRERQKLNAPDELDYEAVLKTKIKVLKKLFDQYGRQQLRSKAYKQFFTANRHWLQPYAVFCYLRDKYKTVDYSKWKTHTQYKPADVAALFKSNPVVDFYCFLQYHLHLQLKEAVAYAHKKGVVIKGDIPIGVYRYGCDTWVAPELYHMNLQAGAPPDDFAVNGQNWGFPTYNWQQMQQDHFGWWRSRFEQMSHYFDAFRIDHILGFFRIWSIPLEATLGIMGYFDPSIPVPANEFYDRGIAFSEDRYSKPFINNIVLQEVFGEETAAIKKQFLITENGFDYSFLPEFDTQRKIENWFALPENKHNCSHLKQALLRLHANILILKRSNQEQVDYYPRFDLHKTLSFRALPHDQQERLKSLYNDYYFRRQDLYWKKESLKKLPQLKAATNMLICGEDLGLVPSSVPEVMKELGILSLEIQRMPKQTGLQFFDPADAPYLSVVSPSTHDMSTLRGWWEEDRKAAQVFYNRFLHLPGEAPLHCEAWINKEIIRQHLQSPAMWAICQIQDLMGSDEAVRRKNPHEERINIPADPHHYWRYRMHLTLEALNSNTRFTEMLRAMIAASGR
ncbi:4-alpha-glucanotransferase [Niabella ginsenosidivorans]|uniref:4-alpha-glucanotransferase n=1 Tax=Niabella ginsenosidivorans TaxID=1176587 RepID=A0A1A9I1B5_9BACT|nr:4-alpha-glucanotransferase [Niabella ginsenosidivorans]ANH81313.1 4-alpha-glucanotransferase [Niabella ginsenosidivorans]